MCVRLDSLRSKHFRRQKWRRPHPRIQRQLLLGQALQLKGLQYQ